MPDNLESQPNNSASSEPTTYAFSPLEIQKLAAYRAAVAGHFYSDWEHIMVDNDGVIEMSSTCVPIQEVERFTTLRHTSCLTGKTTSALFTPTEMNRMRRYRSSERFKKERTQEQAVQQPSSEENSAPGSEPAS